MIPIGCDLLIRELTPMRIYYGLIHHWVVSRERECRKQGVALEVEGQVGGVLELQWVTDGAGFGSRETLHVTYLTRILLLLAHQTHYLNFGMTF